MLDLRRSTVPRDMHVDRDQLTARIAELLQVIAIDREVVDRPRGRERGLEFPEGIGHLTAIVLRVVTVPEMRLLLLAGLLVSCSKPSSPPIVANQTTTPTTTAPPTATRGLEFRVVDSDSAYMKRVFAHVGLDSAGNATDPQALAAGIGVEVDAWADESATRHTDYYLQGKDRSAIQRYVEALAARDPVFRVPDDRDLGFERSGDKWRSYLLERTVSLDGSTIATAVKSFDPNSGRPIVLLEFDASGAKMLAALTKRIVGKKLAIVFKGQIKSAPIINGEITGGRASIAMGGTEVAAQEKEADDLTTTLNRR